MPYRMVVSGELVQVLVYLGKMTTQVSLLAMG